MNTIASYLLRIGGTDPFDFNYVQSVSPDLLIIERTYINTDPNVDQIAQLEASGTTVAGYMNVGRIDANRSYYNEFPGLGADLDYADVNSADWISAMKMEVDELLGQGFDVLYFDDLLAYNDGPNATA